MGQSVLPHDDGDVSSLTRVTELPPPPPLS